ncbi:MAG: hypothetical protein O9301_05015 [Leptospira sp.]|nr:hypothetical protein [Leptospira sp.]
MIWYLRVFGVFVLVLGGMVVSQGDLTHETEMETSLKWDAVPRSLSLAYFPKSFKVPLVGEEVAEKRLGETVKIQVKVWNLLPEPQTTVESVGYAHYAKIEETISAKQKENNVQLVLRTVIRPKEQIFSKLYVLFFGKSDGEKLQKQLETSFPKIEPKAP